MSKHTPGPWNIHTNPHSGLIMISPGIAEINTGNKDFESNIDLIAAAPDMLAMLEELEWRWDGTCYACLECQRVQGYRHEEDCKLGNLLKRIKGQGDKSC